MTARSISTAELKAECTVLERAVRTAKLATDDTLAPHRPGGAENPAKDARGWLSYYRHLHRLHATQGGTGGGAVGLSREQADALVLDALRAEPVAVTRVGAAPGDAPLHVHPKSFDALLHVHALDRQLAYMLQRHATIMAELDRAPRAELADVVPQLVEAISYTYQLIAWIVTTEGPGMPYQADDDRPEPPPHIQALEPWDLVRVCQAHQRHMMRLSALSALLDPQRAGEDGGTRPSWSAFFGTLAMEREGGDTVTLMKHRALAALLAAVQLNADAKAPREREDGA